jgi:23S rRNA pseudouridine2605 synthase
VEVVGFEGVPGAGRTEVRVVIREGRQRQVRRMLQAVGHRVQALRRTGFGPLKLGRLKVGGWRVLGEGELEALRRAVRIEPQ